MKSFVKFLKTGYLLVRLPKWLYNFEKRSFDKYFLANQSHFSEISILSHTPFIIQYNGRSGVFFIYYRKWSSFDFLVNIDSTDPSDKSKTIYEFWGIDYYFSIIGKKFNIRFRYR